jgi:hypothetical protein
MCDVSRSEVMQHGVWRLYNRKVVNVTAAQEVVSSISLIQGSSGSVSIAGTVPAGPAVASSR